MIALALVSAYWLVALGTSRFVWGSWAAEFGRAKCFSDFAAQTWCSVAAGLLWPIAAPACLAWKLYERGTA